MWLEAITVRTANLGTLECQVPGLLRQLSRHAPDVETKAYIRYPTNSDLSFHLIHQQQLSHPSPEGVRLADALRAYGSVDHSTWKAVEQTVQSIRSNKEVHNDS